MKTDAKTLKKYAEDLNKHVFNNAQVITYYAARTTGYNVPSLTGKLEGGEDGLYDITKKVFGNQVKVEKLSGDLANRVSGKYDAFYVKISEDDGFFFRSVITNKGNLSNKDLTPAKLNLNDKTLFKNNFDEAVTTSLTKQNNLPIDILNLAYKLLKAVETVGDNLKPSAEIVRCLKDIPTRDLNILGKNFGEVILAKWCLYNKPGAISIFFPREEANPLADFIVNFNDKPPLNVSAKFEQGANASIKSFLNSDTALPKGASKDEIIAFKAVMEVTYGKSILLGLLEAEKILNTPEYKAIKKMCKNQIVTLDTISNVVLNALKTAGIDSTKTITQSQFDTFKAQLRPFYESINYAGFPGSPTNLALASDSIKKIALLPDNKKYHPIFYAFSVALAKRFNSFPEFTEILNKAATAIKAEQIYLEFNMNAIKVKSKSFQKSKFKFAAGALSYRADNVRMKVEMIK